MLEKFYITRPTNTDLNMYRCGIEDCTPGHSWGPAVRDHYIIHYILDGKGIFQVDGVTYRLEKHDGFLICPGTVVFYQADLEMPWSYTWVGFHGIKAETYLKQANLTHEKPIFRYDADSSLKECFNRMIATKGLAKGREIRLLGLLYEFLSRLIEVAAHDTTGSEGESRKELYVKKAVEFVQMNFSRKISVAEIADYVKLDRSYLYSIFSSYLNTSPQEFIINFRIEKACELMHNSELSIGDISRSVGYEDALVFSKQFKRTKGIPPREFRKRMA